MKVSKCNYAPLLGICMSVALFMTGGFFDHSVAVIGITIVGCLFFMLLKGEEFFGRDKRHVFLIPTVILGMSAIVSFWAVDYMENFMGVMRVGVICLWMYLVRSRDKEEVYALKRLIPILGCITIGISLISLLMPDLTPAFWENNRMSGFFQYANTNGLFYALGILILIYGLNGQKKIVAELIQIIILFVGLLLSGSRSVLLLFLLWGVWYAMRTAEFRKPFILAGGAFLVLGGLYVAITGNTANIGRIFTIFTSNSTLWGRLLYYRDAALLLCKKFFGLGRLGYYYTQGTFQSGIYHIKFVHNDFLQVALDYGVLALVLVLIFLGWQLVKGRQEKSEKELLLFLCGASMLDFHCQYLFIVMLACLFLDYGETIKEKKSQVKENYVMLPVYMVLFLYVGIATGSYRMGNLGLTLSMLPDYTAAQEKVLLNSMGTEQSYEMATRLIEKNPYNLTAYIARGSFYGSRLYVKECIADLDKMLELDPYNVEYYKQYEIMLENIENAILASVEEESLAEDDLDLLRERSASLAVQLSEMKKRTSALAYKIKDVPVFSYE